MLFRRRGIGDEHAAQRLHYAVGFVPIVDVDFVGIAGLDLMPLVDLIRSLSGSPFGRWERRPTRRR
jgi:hypothetical protein